METYMSLLSSIGALAVLTLMAIVARLAWRWWLRAFDRLTVGVALLSSRKRYEAEIATRLDHYL